MRVKVKIPKVGLTVTEADVKSWHKQVGDAVKAGELLLTVEADKAAYEASGRVEGHLLNQYSMSESGDDLRIATTTNSGWGGGVVDCPPNAECAAPVEQTAGQSRVVVLRRNGEVLEQIGMVDGLGPSEQIKSVRYVGDIAYVVTFRQTDPSTSSISPIRPPPRSSGN